MSNLQPADRKLESDLFEIIKKVVELRDGLYSQREGCTCDENHLCAYHTAVYSRLNQVRESLFSTIDKVILGKEVELRHSGDRP